MGDANVGDEGRAPGWYPDERYPEDERYWDGTRWVGTRPRGDHAVRSRSALEAAEEAASQRTRMRALFLVPVGMFLVWLVYTIYQRG